MMINNCKKFARLLCHRPAGGPQQGFEVARARGLERRQARDKVLAAGADRDAIGGHLCCCSGSPAELKFKRGCKTPSVRGAYIRVVVVPLRAYSMFKLHIY